MKRSYFNMPLMLNAIALNSCHCLKETYKDDINKLSFTSAAVCMALASFKHAELYNNLVVIRQYVFNGHENVHKYILTVLKASFALCKI